MARHARCHILIQRSAHADHYDQKTCMQLKVPHMMKAIPKKGIVSREDTWPLELQAPS